ncbi:MAG: ComEC family competence protein [Oscillospiraceae bacterium]|nr:ComEC family competence protein [Oscillospiraceae bacterium]
MNKKPIKNKAAVTGFSYFIGIAATSFADNSVVAAAIILIGLVGALISGMLKKSAVVSLTLVSVAAGALGFTVYDINTRRPVFEKAGTGEGTMVIGTVSEKKELGFYQASYVVKADINGRAAKIMITAPDVHNIGAGDVIEADVTLSEFRNSGIFPERSYNLSRGVLLKGSADSISLVRHGSVTPIDYIRGYNAFIQSEVNSAFPNDVGGLLRAVFVGDKSGLSPRLVQDVRVAGVAHYTAVSGLHMTIIAHMSLLLFGLTPFRNNRRIKFAALVCIVLVFAVFFNLTSSVNRAAIMLIICYGGELFMRKGATLNSLGFALLLMLLFEPYAVFDVGLIMSFSGTFGAGVVTPALLKTLSDGDEKRGLKAKIVEGTVVSVCAGLCVLPASALFFGGVSVLSPLTSIIIMPFFTVAAGAMMLFSFFAVFGAVGDVFLLVAGIMSKIMNEVIGFFGGFSSAWISLEYWFVPFWLAFAIVAIAAIRLVYKSNTEALKAACISVAALALMICVYNMNALNSGNVYIKIYSDSSSAWLTAEQFGVKAVIVTSDTPRAAEILSMQSSNTVVALLNSTRNNEAAFKSLPSLEYIPPKHREVYDISGRFTLGVGEDEATLLINDYDFDVMFTRAANDNATLRGANLTVAYNRVRNKRDFGSDYVVYASRSIPVEFPHERNAYYEPVYLIIERVKE